MKKYYYEGKTREQAIELALEDLKISEEDLIVNKEEEKEVRVNPNDIDNFLFIISNVMHFTTVESYERYRTVFENDEVEISVDEYPFGVCVEVENKSTTKNPEAVVKNWVNKVGLNIKNAYRLSWDDKYMELCEEQGVEKLNEVTFDRPMPSVKKEDKYKK